MRKNMFLVLAGFIFILSGYVFADEGLVGYWPFDEGKGEVAKDSVGEYNGEICNAKWVKGKIGLALEFDGKSSYVEIKDTAESCFDITKMTLCAWIYPKAYPDSAPPINGIAGIVGKGRFTSSTYGLWLRKWKILNFRVWGPFGEGGKAAKFNYRSYECPIDLNQWYHVAVTYDNQKVKLYINGKLDAENTENRLPFINNQSIFIGCTNKGLRPFKGIIDEVKIYNRALEARDIYDEYMRAVDSATGDINVHFEEKELKAVYEGTNISSLFEGKKIFFDRYQPL